MREVYDLLGEESTLGVVVVITPDFVPLLVKGQVVLGALQLSLQDLFLLKDKFQLLFHFR